MAQADIHDGKKQGLRSVNLTHTGVHGFCLTLGVAIAAVIDDYDASAEWKRIHHA